MRSTIFLLATAGLLAMGCGGDEEPGAFMTSTATGTGESSDSSSTTALMDMPSTDTTDTSTTTTATSTTATSTTATSTTGGGGCGNATIEPGEQCEGTDLNGFSCVDLGFAGGTLACDPMTCMYDASNCTVGGTSG
jgi:hypothetical protein